MQLIYEFEEGGATQFRADALDNEVLKYVSPSVHRHEGLRFKQDEVARAASRDIVEVVRQSGWGGTLFGMVERMAGTSAAHVISGASQRVARGALSYAFDRAASSARGMLNQAIVGDVITLSWNNEPVGSITFNKDGTVTVELDDRAGSRRLALRIQALVERHQGRLIEGELQPIYRLSEDEAAPEMIDPTEAVGGDDPIYLTRIRLLRYLMTESPESFMSDEKVHGLISESSMGLNRDGVDIGKLDRQVLELAHVYKGWEHFIIPENHRSVAFGEYLAHQVVYCHVDEGQRILAPYQDGRSTRTCDMRVEAIIKENDLDEGFYGVITVSEEPERVIDVSFRGTHDVKTVHYDTSQECAGFDAFQEYGPQVMDELQRIADETGITTVRFNGHSLGGCLAAQMTDLALEEMIQGNLAMVSDIRLNAFQAPGVSTAINERACRNLSALMDERPGLQVSFNHPMVEGCIVQKCGQTKLGATGKLSDEVRDNVETLWGTGRLVVQIPTFAISSPTNTMPLLVTAHTCSMYSNAPNEAYGAIVHQTTYENEEANELIHGEIDDPDLYNYQAMLDDPLVQDNAHVSDAENWNRIKDTVYALVHAYSYTNNPDEIRENLDQLDFSDASKIYGLGTDSATLSLTWQVIRNAMGQSGRDHMTGFQGYLEHKAVGHGLSALASRMAGSHALTLDPQNSESSESEPSGSEGDDPDPDSPRRPRSGA